MSQDAAQRSVNEDEPREREKEKGGGGGGLGRLVVSVECAVLPISAGCGLFADVQFLGQSILDMLPATHTKKKYCHHHHHLVCSPL